MAASKAYIIYSKAMDTKQACKNTGKGYKAACPFFLQILQKRLLSSLQFFLSFVMMPILTGLHPSKARQRLDTWTKLLSRIPVNMLVGSKILVHAMPIFYLQIYKNNDVACGPNFMLDEFSGNPLYFQSPLGEELNHPLLCLLLPLQQARRSTTGSGDKKSVSKWSIRYVY